MVTNLARKADVQTGNETHEARRLEAVAALDVLDSPQDPAYDRLVRLVRATFGVEMAMISIIDAHRQWYKATVGFDVNELPVRETFCRRTMSRNGPLIVRNAATHPVFADNPYVTGEGGVRFYAGVPLKTRDGYAVGTICAVDSKPRSFSETDLEILKDLAAVAIDQLELRERALKDELTGVFSRRAFREAGEKQFARAKRDRQDFSVICFDLDHFKSINDIHGHAIGDKVLKQVAKTCQSRIREGDLLARPGGEEFAILIPGSNLDSARALAETLRLAVSKLRFTIAEKKFTISASFGIAGLDDGVGDLETLLVNADMALYQAKENGRNCCVAWGTDWIDNQAPRRRVLKAGTISYNAGLSQADCTIRTLGPDGAGLDVIDGEAIPNRFNLALHSEGRFVSCEVTARTASRLEVRFV